jgi:hypothetical protein
LLVNQIIYLADMKLTGIFPAFPEWVTLLS